MHFKSIFKHYWKFVQEYKWGHVALLFTYGLAPLIASIVSPLVYKNIVDEMANPGPETFSRLNILLLILAVSFVAENVLYRTGDYLMIRIQGSILKKLYDYSLEKISKHSYAFFSNAFVGGLVTKTKRFVGAFETLHDEFMYHVWLNGINLLAAIVVLWYQSWILGATILGWLIFHMIIVFFLVRVQIPKSLASATADSKTTGHYADIISNILIVKMFGAGKREGENFYKTTQNQKDKKQEAWMQEGFVNNMIQGVSVTLFELMIVGVSVYLWRIGVVTAGTIVLVQLYAMSIFNIVWMISRNLVRVSAALTDAEEIVEIFDREPDVCDPENPEELAIKEGKIEFKDVTFAYENAGNVFNSLNLTIEPGEKIALVGHSGAGKTTIVKLLLRFTDIQKGEILIDGQDVTKVTQDDLRKNISYVPQDPALFHRTLRENISYAKPTATDTEIVDVSKRAHADDFIQSLPKKYETLVGERGIKLSGGEKQRVAIARAMLEDAPIVILDEATSALDSISEGKIQEAFEELMKGKTTIVIAHRLSTIKKMDRIIVFEGGAIAEMGTHLQLIKKKGIYAELWKSQIGGFISE